MKKSEIYRIAQIAVLQSEDMRYKRAEQIEVLRELMDKEQLELFREKQAKENKGGENNDTI